MMGLEAGQRILQAIRGVSSKERSVRLHKTEPELVVRMSTAPPALVVQEKNGSRTRRRS
jgi:DNA-binding LacI/PurR family transcriptional regulator